MIFCYGRLSTLIQEVSRSQRKNGDGGKRKQQYMWRQDFSLLAINSGKPKASRENEPPGEHLYVCVPVNLLLATLHLSKGQCAVTLIIQKPTPLVCLFFSKVSVIRVVVPKVWTFLVVLLIFHSENM